MVDTPTNTTPAGSAQRKGRFAKNLRRWLRSLHRDAGYLIVGLTFVYAISGLAVNHIDDWNANYTTYKKRHRLGALPSQQAAATKKVLAQLGIRTKPNDVFRTADDELEITFGDKTLIVTLSTGEVEERGRQAMQSAV